MRTLIVRTSIAKSTMVRFLSLIFDDRRYSAALMLVILAWTSSTSGNEVKGTLDEKVIRESFIASSDGYSTDELLVRDDLRDSFLDEVSKRIGRPVDETLERAALLKLLALRKAGKLKHPAERRGPTSDEAVFPIAEIASHAVMDRHRVTTDTILADRRLRAELQAEAEKISKAVDAYAVRKSVLSLRKRRELVPELVLKVIDWPREVFSMQLAELRMQLDAGKIPSSPGIYLFRDETGYLYIGEADDLARRLAQHSSESDRVSLANYISSNDPDRISVELHVFPDDSPAQNVTARRAYESELIRSRAPKFNVRP